MGILTKRGLSPLEGCRKRHGGFPPPCLAMPAVSKPVSRVLSWMIIYLRRRLPGAFSDPTRGRSGPLHRPPIRSCSGWGLPSRPVAAAAGALLPHRSTLAEMVAGRWSRAAGLLLPDDQPPTTHGQRPTNIRAVCISVALSLRSPSLGVTQHPALRSPDFPRTPPFVAGARDHPVCSQRLWSLYIIFYYLPPDNNSGRGLFFQCTAVCSSASSAAR